MEMGVKTGCNSENLYFCVEVTARYYSNEPNLITRFIMWNPSARDMVAL